MNEPRTILSIEIIINSHSNSNTFRGFMSKHLEIFNALQLYHNAKIFKWEFKNFNFRKFEVTLLKG